MIASLSLKIGLTVTLDLAKCSCLNIQLTLHTLCTCMSVYTVYKLLISYLDILVFHLIFYPVTYLYIYFELCEYLWSPKILNKLNFYNLLVIFKIKLIM